MAVIFARNRFSAHATTSSGVRNGRGPGAAEDFEKPLFLELVTYPIERFDRVKGLVDLHKFLAQTLDMAVDGTIVYVHLIVIGDIHQGVTTLDHAGPGGKRLQDEEFCDRERNRLV